MEIVVVIPLYVDDLLIFPSSIDLISERKKNLSDIFEVEDLARLNLIGA